MRNLKRALCLALACVMLLGMMVVGASASYADFTDKGEIKHGEAVSTLVELGVISGKEDGSFFDPNGIITRYEMSKLICVVLNGGIDPKGITKDVPTYADTKGSWAEGYVEWCSSLNIVAGDGAGNFNGTNTVTGSEAAKMLLCAVGYSAEVEGYTGASWAINANRQANQLEFYKDIEGINPSAGLTRDNAAQMVFNALNCDVVRYDNALVVNGVVSGNSQLVETDKTMLEKYFGVTKFEGVVVRNENGSIVDTTIASKNNTSLKLTSAITDDKNATVHAVGAVVSFKTSTPYSVIGKQVTIYAKNNKSGVYQNVFGAPVLSGDVTVFSITKAYTNKNTLASDMSKAGIKSVSLNALLMDNFYGYRTVGDQLAIWQAAQAVGADTSIENFFKSMTGNGVEITVINNDSDDTAADYVIYKKLLVGEVTTYNTNGNNGDGYYTISIPGGAPIISGVKGEDIVGIEDVAKDDIVTGYELNGKYYVKKTDMVTVTVNEVNGANVLSGSTTYKPSALGTASLSSLALNKDADLYLDEYGYVVFAEGTEDTAHYLFVTAVESRTSFSEAKMKAVLEDGTSVTASVYSIDGTRIDTAATAATPNDAPGPGAKTYRATENGLYSYTVRGDGSYALRKLGAGGADVTLGALPAGFTVTKNAPKLTTGAGSISANAKTIFLVKVGSDWYSYTGISSVPTVALPTNAAIYCKSGTSATFVVVTGGTTSGSTGKSFFVLSETYTKTEDSDGDIVYSVPVLMDGVKKNLVVADGMVRVGAETKLDLQGIGLFKNVSLKADGSVEFAKIKAGGSMTIITAAQATVCKDGVVGTAAETLSYNSDTVVYVVDGTSFEVGSISDIITGTTATGDSQIIMVAGKDDAVNIAEYIYIIK